MIDDDGEEDADEDRHGAMKPARQHQGEELRLVAELGEGDEPERDQKRFHIRRRS